ncbi:MAG TPA: cyanophycin synthetase, partial [Candidatus Binatus sp.]|nr:cyanophycin synthetase [Candidatus Binatus sp.]
KPGVPLALGAVPPDAERVIAARAAAVGAPIARAGIDGVLEESAGGLVFRGSGIRWDGLTIGLPGRFQRDNAEVALLTLALARDRFPCQAEAVRRGLSAVRWPGRLAVVRSRPLVVLDGAHNPAGIATLVRELPDVAGTRPVDLVFAVMADKDWVAMLGPLLPRIRRAVVTRVGRRGAAPGEVAAALGGRVAVEAVDDPRMALRAALSRAEPEAAVLVTGSLFLVGEAYAELESAGDAGPLFEPWKPPGAGGTEAGA